MAPFMRPRKYDGAIRKSILARPPPADINPPPARWHLRVSQGGPDDPPQHLEGRVDPRRDVETMETELILADHTIASRRIEKLEANVKKSGRDEDKKELEAVRKCLAALEKEMPLREVEFPEEDEKRLRGFTFL